jgi:hypothetical protein
VASFYNNKKSLKEGLGKKIQNAPSFCVRRSLLFFAAYACRVAFVRAVFPAMAPRNNACVVLHAHCHCYAFHLHVSGVEHILKKTLFFWLN